MSVTIITEAMAWRIVAQFVREITQNDEGGVLAVYVIGSLGGGYFCPGRSDVDTVIIVQNDAPITQEEIDVVATRYWHEFDIPKGFGSIMMREHELFPPYDRSRVEDFEFSVEVARLKIQGKQVYKSYRLADVPMPGRDDLICDAIIMENWLDNEFGYPMFDKLKITGCINCILGYMRRYLMIEQGVYEFNKHKVIDSYLQHSPPLVDMHLFQRVQVALHDPSLGQGQLLNELRRFGTQMRDYMNIRLLSLDLSR